MIILKNVNNGRMSLTVTRIEAQKEEIIEERPLREGEDFNSFHQSGSHVDNIGQVVPKTSPEEARKQINNPFAKHRQEAVNETRKNINAGGFSFGITIKKSY